MRARDVKRRFLAAAVALCWWSAASAATLPSVPDQEVLIRTNILTFNDANLTGNYTVMRERAAKPFRDQISAEQLKQSFKDFVDKAIDLSDVAVKPIVPSQESKIDDSGVLQLAGTIVLNASATVTYSLRLIPSEGRWKIVGINVKL